MWRRADRGCRARPSRGVLRAEEQECGRRGGGGADAPLASPSPTPLRIDAAAFRSSTSLRVEHDTPLALRERDFHLFGAEVEDGEGLGFGGPAVDGHELAG